MDRMVIVRNPNSSHASEWEAYRDDIIAHTSFHNPVVIESEADPAATTDKLAHTIRDGDLVYGMGGDGLATTVAGFLGRATAPDAALMFSDLGNACNAFHATVDTTVGNRPSDIIRQGTLRSIFPLRGRVDSPASEQADAESHEHIALTIFSVGAIATGAAILDQPKHRQAWLRNNPHTRYPYEVFISLAKVLPRTRTLEISDVDGSHERLALEILAAHAPRIGKAALFNSEISDDSYLFGTMKNKLPWHLLPAMHQLTKGTFPVERIPAGAAPIAFKLTESRRNRHAMYEVDGEAKRLALGSVVAIDQVAYGDATHRPIQAVFARAA